MKRKLRIGLMIRKNDPLYSLYVNSFTNTSIEFVSFISNETISLRTEYIHNERYKNLFQRNNEMKHVSEESNKIFVSHHDSPESIKKYIEHDISLLVNCGVGKKLNSKVLNSVKFGIISCHPGKLPEYRGSTCPEWAILNNDKVFNSIFLMNEEYDSGPIFGYKEVKIDWNETYEQFRCNVLLEGIDYLSQVVWSIQNNMVQMSDFHTPLVPGNLFKTMSEETLNKEIKSKFKGFANRN